MARGCSFRYHHRRSFRYHHRICDYVLVIVAEYHVTQVKETDKDRTYVVDVGQMTAGDLDLKLQEDVLTLRGFHEEKTENSVSSKSFQRSFTVPSDMKMETIKTELKDGKLSIKMSKRDPPITIPIQSA